MRVRQVLGSRPRKGVLGTPSRVDGNGISVVCQDSQGGSRVVLDENPRVLLSRRGVFSAKLSACRRWPSAPVHAPKPGEGVKPTPVRGGVEMPGLLACATVDAHPHKQAWLVVGRGLRR